jgi:hypothetical protein
MRRGRLQLPKIRRCCKVSVPIHSVLSAYMCTSSVKQYPEVSVPIHSVLSAYMCTSSVRQYPEVSLCMQCAILLL